MAEITLEIEPLRQLYATKRGAKAVLDYASQLASVSSGATMTLDSLHSGLKGDDGPSVPRRELIKTLRAFAQFGCGRFITGRHGGRSRFIWSIAPMSLAAALGRTASQRAGQTQADSTLFSHPFRLRPGLNVALNLPHDLTPHEADRLARFVLTLALDPEMKT